MAEEKRYDLAIIGAGPGGYVAAARAGQLGMKVACVDKFERLGGVCLNYGCIPSKALLDSSEHVNQAKNAFAKHGIKVGEPEIDLKTMMARKDSVVKALTDNVAKLLEANNVEVFRGAATLEGPGTVAIEGKDAGKIEAEKILIATGSRPVALKGLEFEGKSIVTSTEALAFDEVPKRLLIVGGGYVGLELGSVWARLGAKVTVVEMTDRIAGGVDGQLSRHLLRILKKQGIDFKFKTRVTGAEARKKTVKVTMDTDGEETSQTCEKVLVAVGRKPLTEGLGLENLGVAKDENGCVGVDENYRTSVGGVYAIGDVIAGPMLAHKASAEGRAAVEIMAGKAGAVNYDAVPMVIYTFPEAAAVGKTEEDLRQNEIPYCTGTFPLTGAGRARCMGETEGMVKILSHQKTDRVLGVHIIAPRASDMIAEAVFAIEFGAAAEDIARIMHGHPTFAEALQEAALVTQQCSIYAG
ncbi:MAG: dihydrolipoyl dehydrogenase [Thermodesulfobacteriota bacterium]